MKRYGKTLMHHDPEGTTQLLKGLCTNYQPSGEAAETNSLNRNRVNMVSLTIYVLMYDFHTILLLTLYVLG